MKSGSSSRQTVDLCLLWNTFSPALPLYPGPGGLDSPLAPLGPTNPTIPSRPGLPGGPMDPFSPLKPAKKPPKTSEDNCVKKDLFF